METLHARVLIASGLEASMGPSILVDGDIQMQVPNRTDYVLQWGRRFSSTETGSPQGGRVHGEGASMGASILVDGDVPDGQLPACQGDADFNGAVDSRRRRLGGSETGTTGLTGLQWGRRFSSTETGQGLVAGADRVGLASMGPSILVDGDGSTPRAPS